MHFSLKQLAVAAFYATNLGSAYVIPQFFQEAFQQEEPIENYLPQLNDDDSSAVAANIPKPHIPYFMKPHVESEKLQDKIKVDDLNATAWDLYRLANYSTPDYGHPTRVIGSKGHNKTMEYILNAFDDMQDYYDVSLQEFEALSGKIISFNLSDAETGKSFANTTAFALSPPVDGVLFGDKSNLAGKFGFTAVVIYDNEPKSKEGLHGTLGEPTKHTVATVGVPYKVGKKLIANIALNIDYSLYFAMDSYVEFIKTKNIIADTKHGDPDNIVALGAHSDSVEEGPGINDDGSGTISLLNVAKQLTHFKINNKYLWTMT
ncbi:BBF_collapsed_G0004690.mRNA.1.CDS.1 [Saccharomyces cerevisiae]|nr:BBF_collapsed_G0004690.mRNA.1.CDS.1 [Saccharomyces cerevisiae]